MKTKDAILKTDTETETEKNTETKTVTFVFNLTYSDGKEVYSNGEYHTLTEEKALFFKSLGFGEISVGN